MEARLALPSLPVGCGVREHRLDEHRLPLVVDLHDQPVFIPADIEDRAGREMGLAEN
jgi:hypothetical protein